MVRGARRRCAARRWLGAAQGRSAGNTKGSSAREAGICLLGGHDGIVRDPCAFLFAEVLLICDRVQVSMPERK